MSITRVGLRETKGFADGYDAIFGKKSGKKTADKKAEKGEKKAKKKGKKK